MRSRFYCLALLVIAALAAPVSRAADRGGELIAAAENGVTARMKSLLDAGVDVNSKDKNGRTPLMVAAAHLQLDAVRMLLARGADTQLRDKAGLTAYAMMLDPSGAIPKQNEAIVRLLPPPKPVRISVDAAWIPEALISSCLMPRNQLITYVDQMHLDALVLTAFQGNASEFGGAVLRIVGADRRGVAAPAQPESSEKFDELVSLEVRPGAACGTSGDMLNLAIDVRVFRGKTLVLKQTFGGGLRGLNVRNAASAAQYLPFYDGWVKSHSEQVYRTVFAAVLKSGVS